MSRRNPDHGKYGSGAHTSWKAMKQRCDYILDPAYPRYGGVGIKYVPEWKWFEDFYADMGDRPKGSSLDRIDNSKGYSKENCRWATIEQQNSARPASKSNSSGVVGVCREGRYWRAQGTINGIRTYLYRGSSFEAACKARKNWELANGIK